MKIKVGEIIRAKREEKNISLVAFARELNISPGYLSQIENGIKKNPNLDILLRIIHRLDIDLTMLLGLEDKEENYLVKIPSLLKLILARDRNSRVLEDPDVLKRFCELTERVLETKYLLENPELYKMFLDDLMNQTEATMKRYVGMQILLMESSGKHEGKDAGGL
ncbi:MAG: helix-turn-helix transcriptional regulator [Clostridiaceae bacterium]|jgi:transcriptional regulator with XRE-family HTH domain|nr:helix-turn-helix transcriptional regulator [Clostridiaceae bacterium]